VRGCCSTLCAPRIDGSLVFQTPSWEVWIQQGVFPRWVTLIHSQTSYSYTQGKELTFGLRGKGNDAPVWCETDLEVMEARVKATRSLSTTRSDVNAAPDFSPTEQVSRSQKNKLPNGWRLLSEQGSWRPCPIGVYKYVANSD
jgi:hypothetical protein